MLDLSLGLRTLSKGSSDKDDEKVFEELLRGLYLDLKAIPVRHRYSSHRTGDYLPVVDVAVLAIGLVDMQLLSHALYRIPHPVVRRHHFFTHVRRLGDENAR